MASETPTTQDKDKAAAQDKKTLYCSFCAKSQHEVRKLIAAPAVFICDECVELCEGILDEDVTDVEKADHRQRGLMRFVVTVPYATRLADLELQMLPAFYQKVEEAFPKCKIEVAQIKRNRNADKVLLKVSAPIEYGEESLKQQIRDLSARLRVEQIRYLSEKKKREQLEQKLSTLKEDVFDILLEKVKKEGALPGHQELIVTFLDIAGFTNMADAERARVVDLLRSVGQFILPADSGLYINTWGDAVVAGFEDLNGGLKCAAKFLDHLGVSGVDVRASAAWGLVRVKYNALTKRMDIDGDSVNEGARLEALADPGEIIAPVDILHHPDFDTERFLVRRKTVKLKKDLGPKRVGDDVEVCVIRPKPNS
ncbi:MAG: hypothetical protein HOP13_02795 [Alphaproteobacteria bacterium]|nr:hypothetical protein [Alphaproteobacteria bacterium]